MESEPVEHSLTFFRSVAEASPDCIRLLGLDGRVRFMNRRGQILFGIDDFERRKGRYWPDTWPAEYRADIERCIAEASAGRTAGFRGLHSGRWWQTEVSPILGDDGEPVGLLAVSRDVTAEADSTAFLREVLERLPAPVLVKRAADGRFVLVNKAAEDVLGMSAPDLIGKTVFDLVTLEQAEKFTEEDAEVIASRAVKVEEEEQVTTASQGERYFITKKMATFDDHGPSHIFTIFEDVTERREATLALGQALSEAEQANRAKSAFLANMSHEIRTPLNGVIAVADLLARSDLGERQRELVELIRASGGSLQTLLTDILDLAKIESGQIVIEATPFDLGELISSTVALFRLRADEKGLALTSAVDPAASGWVMGDPLRIRQVLSNLLSNAIKFTDGGAVEVSVQRRDDGVRFTVSDTGIGFDDGFKARMFGRFQQADASITRKFGGSGLGLSICRELAALMGGGLDCDAEPGVGARFWFDVPLPATDRPAETVVQGAAPVVDAGLRILVADDHPTNRRVVSLLLADVAEVVCVENGAEAVDIVAREPFDLVLMDMQMPVMDGLTAVRAIRAMGGPVASIPIIVLSANALKEHVQASLESGADSHLSKPVTAESLMKAINRLFEAEAQDAA